MPVYTDVGMEARMNGKREREEMQAGQHLTVVSSESEKCLNIGDMCLGNLAESLEAV